ncbi:MAG TPA: sigma-70 family RNA polymerase sigma factor [Steroidobacteraceae bacterium]|nr:sigma-70 family RNA polymerase sigma factor [Steroidobacteraceae bacterium]
MSRLAEIRVSEELLFKARCGEERAQSSLYAALAPATFGLIRRIVTSRALAEDLFQDTMMTVFERLGAFRGEAPLGAWVRRIAITKCLMYLRSPWHRARLAIDRDHDEEALSREELQRLVVQDARAEQLDIERALATLSPTARAVVWLYDVEGYSHEEIAQAFGRSISFSKSQLARAHARMREWFEPTTDRQPCAP